MKTILFMLLSMFINITAFCAVYFTLDQGPFEGSISPALFSVLALGMFFLDYVLTRLFKKDRVLLYVHTLFSVGAVAAYPFTLMTYATYPFIHAAFFMLALTTAIADKRYLDYMRMYKIQDQRGVILVDVLALLFVPHLHVFFRGLAKRNVV